MPQWVVSSETIRPSSFFSPFSVVRPTQFFGIFKKNKTKNDAVKLLFTWNNSCNLKNVHSNSIEKNRNIFYGILRILLIHNQIIMWMLTFHVVLVYQGLLFRDFLWFSCFFFFSSTDRHNIRKRIRRQTKKKGGMALTTNYTKYEGRFSLAIPNFARALLKAYITT